MMIEGKQFSPYVFACLRNWCKVQVQGLVVNKRNVTKNIRSIVANLSLGKEVANKNEQK